MSRTKKNKRRSATRTTTRTRERVGANKKFSAPCDKGMTFEECELAILRTQVDQVQKKIAKRIIQSDDLTNIIQIVEQFLKTKKLVCYGGTAINNILPKKDQFYDKSVEMADYDFFTANAVKDAKELADVYASKGFKGRPALWHLQGICKLYSRGGCH